MSKKNLTPLITDVISCMIELNYSDNSIRHYTEVWKRYLKNTDFSVLDKEDITSFLGKVYGICEGSKKTYSLSTNRSSSNERSYLLC